MFLNKLTSRSGAPRHNLLLSRVWRTRVRVSETIVIAILRVVKIVRDDDDDNEYRTILSRLKEYGGYVVGYSPTLDMVLT